MKVAEILQRKGSDVFHIAPSSTIGAAVAVLSDKNIGAVVVIDSDQAIVGILSERDIVRRIATHGVAAVSLPVDQCMTKKLITCTPQDDLNAIMELMTEMRIRHMPVIQDAKIVGMISIGDVVKRKIQQTEQEAEALRDYIAS